MPENPSNKEPRELQSLPEMTHEQRVQVAMKIALEYERQHLEIYRNDELSPEEQGRLNKISSEWREWITNLLSITHDELMEAVERAGI